MLEILLVVMGLMFAGNQHSKEQEFYRGVAYGCVGGVLHIVEANYLPVSDDDIFDYCEMATIRSVQGDLYAK